MTNELIGVEIEQRDGLVVIARLAGELDISVAEPTGRKIAESVPSSARGVVVDTSGLEFMDSSGVSMLFSLARQVGSHRQQLRVVAYRRRTARMECRACELRFSVDILKFGLALVQKPDLAVAADPGGWALAAAITGRLEDDDKGLEAMKEIVGDIGAEAIEGHARALGTWERFSERLQARERGDDG